MKKWREIFKPIAFTSVYGRESCTLIVRELSTRDSQVKTDCSTGLNLNLNAKCLFWKNIFAS